MIEVIIVVALLAIIAGYGIPYSISSIARSYATGERDLMVSLLTQARARSIANVNESAHGVYIDAAHRRYVVYARSTSCSGATTTTTHIPMVSSSTLSGPLNRCFAPLSVRVPNGIAPFTIDMTGTTTIDWAGQHYAVSVNSVGRIDW